MYSNKLIFIKTVYIILNREKLVKKLGLVMGPNILKSSQIPIYGKKWVSVDLILTRYIHTLSHFKQNITDRKVLSKYGLLDS